MEPVQEIIPSIGLRTNIKRLPHLDILRLLAIMVYFLIKYISYKKGFQKHQKIISILGASVFGVYLIEKIIRLLTRPVYAVLAPFLGSFIASLIWCFATCCLAFLIIVPLKNIPIIKKVVNKFI